MLGRKESSEGRSAHAIPHRFKDAIFRPKELSPLHQLFGNASLEDADILLLPKFAIFDLTNISKIWCHSNPAYVNG